MAVRILQLSDPHLLAEPSARLKGILTHEAFRDVIDFVRSTLPPFDHVVLTGDLAHDGCAETYQAARGLLGEWMDCCRIIPGNHDRRESLCSAFPEFAPCGDGPLTFSIAAGHWRLIGLDSLVEGNGAGRLGPEQLDWLTQELAEHSDEPTLVFVHHPPFPVNCVWLDRIGLEQPEAFWKLIAGCSQVKAVSAGHVHHVFEGRLNGTPVYTSPSTSFQFDPRASEPVLDMAPPGFRVFELESDGFRTEVVRLPTLKHPPS